MHWTGIFHSKSIPFNFKTSFLRLFYHMEINRRSPEPAFWEHEACLFHHEKILGSLAINVGDGGSTRGIKFYSWLHDCLLRFVHLWFSRPWQLTSSWLTSPPYPLWSDISKEILLATFWCASLLQIPMLSVQTCFVCHWEWGVELHIEGHLLWLPICLLFLPKWLSVRPQHVKWHLLYFAEQVCLSFYPYLYG